MSAPEVRPIRVLQRPLIRLLGSLLLALPVLATPRSVDGQAIAPTNVAAPAVAGQRRITIGLPSAQGSPSGELRVAPNVGVAGAPIPSGYDAEAAAQAAYQRAGQTRASWISNTTQLPASAVQIGPPITPMPGISPGGVGVLPMPNGAVMNGAGEQIPVPYPLEDPAQLQGTFEEGEPPVVARFGSAIWQHFRSHPWMRPVLPCQFDQGLGAERVGLAPNVIDISQPMNNFRIRQANYFGARHIDRVEYLWARSSAIGGRGPPLLEQSVNFQELRLQMEMGLPRFSLATELPLRWVDPTLNVNTGGLGDLNTTAKTVLIQGTDWQITQIFRTYIPTGNPAKGLGSGNTGLEPGILARYRWSPSTYIHQELKYWFALGGHPDQSGRMLRYGLGISRVFYETDDFAVLPTFESIFDFASDGQQTEFPSPVPVGLQHIPLIQLCPGTRFSWDTGGDSGLFELSISGGLSVSRQSLYDAMLRTDIRWMF